MVLKLLLRVSIDEVCTVLVPELYSSSVAQFKSVACFVSPTWFLPWKMKLAFPVWAHAHHAVYMKIK